MASYNNTDLSKTSKSYQKRQSLIKTQTLTKNTNNNKVFIVNGKKY
jgi:hypothetical protein